MGCLGKVGKQASCWQGCSVDKPRPGWSGVISPGATREDRESRMETRMAFGQPSGKTTRPVKKYRPVPAWLARARLALHTRQGANYKYLCTYRLGELCTLKVATCTWAVTRKLILDGQARVDLLCDILEIHFKCLTVKIVRIQLLIQAIRPWCTI